MCGKSWYIAPSCDEGVGSAERYEMVYVWSVGVRVVTQQRQYTTVHVGVRAVAKQRQHARKVKNLSVDHSSKVSSSDVLT